MPVNRFLNNRRINGDSESVLSTISWSSEIFPAAWENCYAVLRTCLHTITQSRNVPRIVKCSSIMRHSIIGEATTVTNFRSIQKPYRTGKNLFLRKIRPVARRSSRKICESSYGTWQAYFKLSRIHLLQIWTWRVEPSLENFSKMLR